MSEEPDARLDRRVRARLRQLRTDRGLTLRQVAGAASIDVSTLSRLETGERRLAIDHLPALAAALGVSIDQLLGPAVAPDPRVRSEPTRYDGMTLWPLTNRGPAAGPPTYRCRIDAERDTPPEPLPVHDGYDWMYVLSGRLRLVLGDGDLVVEPGEVVEFSTLTPHWFGALDGAVEVLATFGPHGERTHLHG